MLRAACSAPSTFIAELERSAKFMNPIFKFMFVKVLKSILAFISIMMIAIYAGMAENPIHKFYPVLLLGSIMYLQWLSWDFFFEIIGVPTSDETRIRSHFKRLFKKLLLDRLILLGYCAILASFFNWYMPSNPGMPIEIIKHGLILIGIGVLARMFSVVRMLIGEKYETSNH
jgi:hypothetical protein